MKKRDDLSVIVMEILDHISGGKQYDYAELESYILQRHPEWAALFNDPEARTALAAYLRSDRTVGREEVLKILEKITN